MTASLSADWPHNSAALPFPTETQRPLMPAPLLDYPGAPASVPHFAFKRLAKRFASMLLLGAGSLLAVPASADTLVDNIQGRSIQRDGTVQQFSAMIIGDDGKIARIITDGESKPGKVDYRHDGKGRFVLPGFIDSHAHVMGLGLSRMTLDLTPTRTLEEAQARLAAYAAAHPDRPWLVGRGWNQDAWGLGRFPNAADLDAVAGERPVLLTHVDGDAAWANSAALKAAGITAQTPDPAGGRIERLAGGRTPSGILRGNAVALVSSKVPPPRASDRDIALHEAQELLLANGLTAVVDMGTTIEDWMTFRRAGDAGRLRIRIVSYADTISSMLLIGGTGPTPWLYQDRLRLAGVHFALDGSLATRGALLNAPYADNPATSGLAVLDGTQLRNLISRAAMDNFQVAIQASGDRAVSEALGAIDDLVDDYKGDRRWRIEQADLIAQADLERLGRNGIIASMQPAALSARYAMTDARLGAERASSAYAWNGVLGAKAKLAFGSGSPATSPSALAGIASAISREDAAGQPFGGWNASQTIGVDQALAAFTSGAAYAAFAEGRFGQLAEGEQADFIMMDEDILEMDAGQLREAKVLETWVGGVQRYAAGRRAAQLDTTGAQDTAESVPERQGPGR